MKVIQNLDLVTLEIYLPIQVNVKDEVKMHKYAIANIHPNLLDYLPETDR
jgi:hypothetical protein